MTTTQNHTTIREPGQGESRRSAERDREGMGRKAEEQDTPNKAAEHAGPERQQPLEKDKKAGRLSLTSAEELARADDEGMTAPEVSK